MKQDGVSLKSVPGFNPSSFIPGDPIKIEVGRGIFGKFTGTIVDTLVELEV